MELVLSNSIRNKITWLETTFWVFLFIALFSLPLSEAIKNIFLVGAYTQGLILLILRKGEIKISPIGWALLFYLSVSLLSAINSSYFFRAIRGVWDILSPTLLYIILINTIDSHRRIKTLLYIILLSIGIGAILGITEYLLWPDNFTRLKIHSLGSTAGYLVIVIGLMIGMFINMRLEKRERVVLIIITLLSFIALILTNYRTQWGTLLIMFLVFSLLNKIKASYRTILSFLLIFVIFIITIVILDQKVVFSRIRNMATPLKDPAIVARMVIWKSSWAMFTDNPILGVGPKCFQTDWNWERDENRKRYNVPSDTGQAHNMLLNVAAEMGIMGVIALLVWLGMYAYLLFKSRKDINNDLALSLWYGVLGGLIAILIGGMTESFIGAEISLLIMTILALFYSSLQVKEGD